MKVFEGLREAFFKKVPLHNQKNLFAAIYLNKMAERGGFEPSVGLPPHLISSQAHSSTLSSLRRRNEKTFLYF